GGEKPVVDVRRVGCCQGIPSSLCHNVGGRQERAHFDADCARAEGTEAVVYVLVERVDLGVGRHDCNYADSHAQTGLDWAQQVSAERFPGKTKTFKSLLYGLHLSSGPVSAPYGSATGGLNYGYWRVNPCFSSGGKTMPLFSGNHE